MLKISFILPCYNVEPYIGRCLDSILHQDMPIEEYEIICVNDCSPDNLRDVVIDYQNKFANVKLIEHTENRTSGGARNTGIEVARGEYLWFVDPDDMIEKNCLGTFYHLASSNNSDIVFFNFQDIDDNGICTKYKIVKRCLDKLNGISFVSEMFPEKRLAGISAIWHSIYKREFCVQNHICFPEIKSSQDVVFVWKCILTANNVIASDAIGYTVCSRSDSMTGSVGKYKSNAIFSATILYTNELLNMIVDYSDKIPILFKNDILREIKLSLDDDSRKILQSPICHKLDFFRLLKQNRNKIDRMAPYMNDNTKRIFDYNSNICSWLLFLDWFRIKKILKTHGRRKQVLSDC